MPARLAPNLPRHKAWPAVCALFITTIAALGALETRPVAAEALSAPPVAVVYLQPTRAYVDTTLRGSASFSDPAGHREDASRYRWLVNGSAVLSGTVPQTILLPLDGDLLSTDGEAAVQGPGLAFVPGRFGQAVQLSAASHSRLGYASMGNVDPNEGSLELWVQFTHNLTDTLYDDYPRLFSYVIDDEHQLYVEVNDDRVILTSRNEGRYYGTWPDPPGWRAGEWHFLAVTWSASTDACKVYYDGVLAATGEFPALRGSAGQFNLGGTPDGWGVTDAALDDVRLSRHALSGAEVSAAYARGGPASNDEVFLTPGRAGGGDLVTFELTPCDAPGACGAVSRASVTLAPAPLGELLPATGLLPSSSVSVTLQLTTTAPADCRCSEQPGTRYADMPLAVQTGQGSTDHSILVSDLHDLDDRRFFVRCRDLATGRDPDDYQRQTHLRVLGPWAGDYPRIANIWGGYDPAYGVPFFAGYDLFVLGWWAQDGNQAAAMRAANPNAKVLLSQNATYSDPQWDALTRQWWDSRLGDPCYNCLLRNTRREIVVVEYWGHPMYNMTVAYCRDVLARQSVDNLLSLAADQGADLAYDGIYWDRLHDSISWLSPDLDSDLDGRADDPQALDAAYVAGMKDFFTQVRARLPHAILMGNDGPQIYNPWLNGRLYEWQLSAILDGSPWVQWDEVTASYRDWCRRGHTPHTTFIESAPEPLFSAKYTFRHLKEMPLAMEEEAAASFQRMRFGLTTALMGDGLFSYDYGPDWHGNLWWYDEFGAPQGITATTALAQGYLGQPTGEPALLVDRLDTPNPLRNGSFEQGTQGWQFWVNTEAGTAAAWSVEPGAGVYGGAGAHVSVTQPTEDWHVALIQESVALQAGSDYTLSFWARSDVTRTLPVVVMQQQSPWADYGFGVAAQLTPQWQEFHLTDDAGVTAQDGKLQFMFGDTTGEVWLDDVRLQQGALGVWARPFQHGLVVVNATHTPQSVALTRPYHKLSGDQAPLFQVRVDDDQARIAAGWSEAPASYAQFGSTVHTATAPRPQLTIAYTPTLAYTGLYQVLAWVVPTATQGSTVRVTIRHATGQSVVWLDETRGEIGWHDLGTYPFAAGTAGGVELAATGSGRVVADCLKWVSGARYNDGSLVDQLSLQALDGIVLLNVETPVPTATTTPAATPTPTSSSTPAPSPPSHSCRVYLPVIARPAMSERAHPETKGE